MGRRYAEDTKVSVERSIEELRRLAERYSSEEFSYAMTPRGGTVMFRLEGIPLRYDVPFPTGGNVAEAEQEWRRQWRVVCLQAKAQFETWQAAELSVVRAFLPQLVTGDGRAAGDVVEELGTDGLAAHLEQHLRPALTTGDGGQG